MSGRTLLLAGVVVAVLAAVVAAFLVLESPAEMRRRSLDQQRVSDLRAISDVIDAYWTQEKTLPPDLAALDGWQGFSAPPTDPVTDVPYRYRVTGDATYELCATFATETSDRDPGRRIWVAPDKFWRHPAGDHCFELEAEKVER